LRISRDDDLFVMTHVPGPSHNYLALRFGNASRPKLVDLRPDDLGAVQADRVLDEVLNGLAAANAELGTSYELEEIRFCRDDTPRRGIYTEMARLLTLAMAGSPRVDES
jgi:hypothetical protein